MQHGLLCLAQSEHRQDKKEKRGECEPKLKM